jgi:cell division protein FtsI (penicillin-binding protein 3)
MSAKKDIMWRFGIIYLGVVMTGFAIAGKILYLQFAEREKYSENSDIAPIKEVTIEANRGNIYSADSKLLAVSVPYYDIRMDLTVEDLTDDYFYSNINALSKELSNLFRDKPWTEYKQGLVRARNQGAQYYLVKRDISFEQMKIASGFPIFNRGRYKSGVRFIEKSRRVKPNGYLASRTIGSVTQSEQGNTVGLEGAYDEYLKGREGVKLYKRLEGDIYVPLFERNELDPEDGLDIVSTIDLNIQDVAEKALFKQLRKHNAKHGTAVLMEVETGEIKAIANLERRADGSYWESVNFAVGEGTVPGSTFKTASMMVAIEQGMFDMDDTVDIGNGITTYYDVKIEDSGRENRKESGKVSVKRAFEISSNVGITKLITSSYAGKESKFIKGLYDLGLNQKLDLDILGEAEPFIKAPDHAGWSGISLPMISMGYEIALTPLQVLTFYNGIANDGKVMKPMFVKEINHRGTNVRSFQPKVINSSLCSRSTLKQIHEMLCGVVEQGTASNLSHKHFRIAGKTGTAQIPDKKTGYRVKSNITYLAAFVGYFPADDPKYSCIVVVNSPSNDIYYGNVVAGPVFWEIASKVYATKLEMHEPVNRGSRPALAEAPYSKGGNYQDLKYLLREFNLEYADISGKADWVTTQSEGEAVKLLPRQVSKRLVPNVVGMGLKDAVFLLEQQGLRVHVNGRGTVRSQSLAPGTNAVRGHTAYLQMSITDS